MNIFSKRLIVKRKRYEFFSFHVKTYIRSSVQFIIVLLPLITKASHDQIMSSQQSLKWLPISREKPVLMPMNKQ